MTAIPLAQFLVEFGVDDRASPGQGNGRRSKAEDDALRAAEAASAVAASYDRGHEEGAASANAAWQELLDSQKNKFERQLELERETWAQNEGAQLGDRLLAGFGEIEAKIADVVVRILKPFLAAKVQHKAMAELLSSLEAAIAQDRGAELEISGPADLLVQLESALSGKTETVSFTPNASCDVRAKIDHTVFETRFAAWLAKIEEATG